MLITPDPDATIVRRRASRTFIAVAIAIVAFMSGNRAVSQIEIDARPTLRGSRGDTIERARYSDRIDILSAGLEYVASSGGGTFFDEYSKLGGDEKTLGSYAAPMITGRIAMSETLRLTVYAGYHTARINETYSVRNGTDLREPPTATVAESFSVLAFPIVGGIEFAPIRTQFTSYVGIGGGIAVNKARWESTLLSTNGTYRRPGRNSDGFGVSPAVRAYAGVDMRFDRPSESRATFRGIFLEASYSFIPITRDYFGELRARGEGIDDGPSHDDASLYLGGLTFTFGLNLQVLRP